MFRWFTLFTGWILKNSVRDEVKRYEARACLIALLIICLSSFGFMVHAAWTDSGIMDELAHIPAGYSYVHNFDFRLNPEHPPLLKALAEVPVLLIQPTFPTDNKAWTTDLNGQWDMGREFLFRSGNDADQIVRLSRIVPILLTILLIILVYFWSREILGARWALMPAFLTAFSPTILAHGHYVTTDIAAAFGFLFATWMFVHYLLYPSRRTLIFAGLAYGVAQAAKFSTVLLIPFFIILVLTQLIVALIRIREQNSAGGRLRPFFKISRDKIFGLAAVALIGYVLVVYPLYFLFTINYPIERQVADTTTILHNFAKGAPAPGTQCNPTRCLAELNIWMAGNPVLQPFAEYFLGILMVVERSAGGNTSYFFGQLSRDGWLTYFPALYVFKEPLPVLILVAIALIFSLVGIVRALVKKQTRILDYLETRFPEFSMILIVIIYWAYSMKSPLNIGLRHLLPTFPFIYILTTSALKRWATSIHWPTTRSPIHLIGFWIKTIFTASLKHSFIFLMLFWLLLESLIVSPYFLSYYNEIGGGTDVGYKYVTDSNYDWGQDFLRLQKLVFAHPEIDKIGIDYFGASLPQYYLGAKAENWWSSRGNPTKENIHWIAISVNTLESARAQLIGTQERNKDDEYQWLIDARPPMPGYGNLPTPDYRAGTSIFVYHLQ